MHKTDLILFLLSSAVMLMSSVSLATTQTIEIPAQYHSLNEPLVAVINTPTVAEATHPVPACLIIHGSGGLFSEGDPGEACDTSPENISDNFLELMSLLDEMGVATIAPASFVSRDGRFCEDNEDDFFKFVAPPLHNAGDGLPIRNSSYKMRRIVVRTLDMLATYNFMCSLDEIDCERTCMIGTSNGGSSVMSYIANDMGRHIKEYTDTNQIREHESNSQYADRITAFQNFPDLPENIQDLFSEKPEPRFVSAISPGCTMRRLVPTVTADEVSFDSNSHLFDLYYPSAETKLHLEIGTDDDVPDACYEGGIRQLQADDYEHILQIPVAQSNYLISTYQGAPHNLLGQSKEGAVIREKIKDLATEHFYLIFKDGMD